MKLTEAERRGRNYILEVDLEYTDECKKKTERFPLAPENKKVDISELNKWQQEASKGTARTSKLICDLHHKENMSYTSDFFLIIFH